MKILGSSALLLALTTLPCANAAEKVGNLDDLLVLYNPTAMWQALTMDQQIKAELKLTKDQESGIKPAIKKWQAVQGQNANKIFKMTGQYDNIRTLNQQESDEFLRGLSQALRSEQVTRLKQILVQRLGMELFHIREIRDSFKLTSEKVADLDSLAAKAKTDLQKLILDGKISRQEGIKQLEALGRGIPDRVLAALTGDQRNKVKEMLGTPYQSK